MHASKSSFACISRLTNQAAFDSLRGSALRWVSPSMVVQVTPARAGGVALCVSASKRTAPRAVDRNRMRRRLKAAALAVLPGLAVPGYAYMLSARAGARTRTMKEIEADLGWCLRKLAVPKPESDT